MISAGVLSASLGVFMKNLLYIYTVASISVTSASEKKKKSNNKMLSMKLVSDGVYISSLMR